MNGTKINAHYVDNNELYAHLVKRRDIRRAAIAEGKEPPTLEKDNYLGTVIYNIANRLSYRPNFINYSFKSEMVGDAIENLVRVVDNFDPDKSKYPFAYMTTVAFQAFVRRIQAEAKQQKIKGAMITEMLVDELFDTQEHDDDGVTYKTHFIEYLKENNFIGRQDEIKPENIIRVAEGLELFMVENEE